VVWLAGFVAVLFHWWNQWRGIRAAVRASLPLRAGREVDALRRLRSNGRLNLPSVELVSSAAKLEPGIFGILRPVLWLPVGIADCLSEKELDAILAHELCHARRRDNLAAAVHMVVEAIFWFHPLVWWLGARLVEERERACDEQVVLLSGEPQAYAEGILKVCEFYGASPLTCAAGVTGADLRKRIEGIMASRFIGELCFWKKLLLTGLLAAAVICPFVSGVFTAEAQTTAPSSGSSRTPGKPGKLEFEVAAIRPSTLGMLGMLGIGNAPKQRISGDRVEYTNITLSRLIAAAYQVGPRQVVCPDWLRNQFFNVSCKMPAGSRKEDAPLMLQSLLAERFRLAIHREPREVQVLTLMVGKDGLKVRELPADDVEPKDGPPAQNSPATLSGKKIFWRDVYAMPARVGVDVLNATVYFEALKTTMGSLASSLTVSHLASDDIIVDTTGLTGRYDISFNCPISMFGYRAPGGSSSTSSTPGPAESASSPEDRLEVVRRAMKPLGLDLQRRKVAIPHVIVDHAEKTPTEN
jgi:bla regulator protein blaR1